MLARTSSQDKASPLLLQVLIQLLKTAKQERKAFIAAISRFKKAVIQDEYRDDLIAVAVLIETIRRIKTTPNEIFFVFSVQEEVGLRGATTSAYGIDPEIGISVDVTLTGDTPKGVKMEVGLGKGPAIKVRDGGMLSDPRLVRLLVDEAERNHLPYQLEILEGGTTDARAMQVTRLGVPVCCVSIPCRYVHSQVEMVDLDDVENAVKLLVSFLSQPISLP